jgi:hypothetical protein
MATGSDVLLEYLLLQVALSGDIGMSVLFLPRSLCGQISFLVETEMNYSTLMHEKSHVASLMNNVMY